MTSFVGSQNPVFKLVVTLALITPWLMPPQGEPSPSVLPWLFSLACTGLLADILPGNRWRTLSSSAVPIAWLAASLISSAIGLSQYFGLAQHFIPWMSPSGGVGEAFANLRQRNQFATLTNIGLAALLWCAASSRLRETPRVMVRVGLLAAAVLLATGNAASSSRTGLVQLLLLVAAGWFWGRRRQPETRLVLAAALLAYAVASLALPALLGVSAAEHGLWGRLSQGDSACTSRLTLWSNVLHLISLRPWLGWGWGELDYAHFMTLYEGPRFCEILDNAHNLPLHLAVELGVPFALLICGATGWLVVRAKPWREQDSTRQLAWLVLGLILLHSTLEYPLWYGPFQMALGLCIGLLWPTRKTNSAAPAMQRKPQWGWRVLATGLLTTAAFAAWDYHRISQIYLPYEQRAAAYRDHTLEKIQSSWLFRNQVRFAEYTLTPLTHGNAGQLHALGWELLHYSPEPRVVEKLIESAVMLRRDDEARYLLARFRAAYPQEHARWAAQQLDRPASSK